MVMAHVYVVGPTWMAGALQLGRGMTGKKHQVEKIEQGLHDSFWAKTVV